MNKKILPPINSNMSGLQDPAIIPGWAPFGYKTKKGRTDSKND